jgi:hypothetical protein
MQLNKEKFMQIMDDEMAFEIATILAIAADSQEKHDKYVKIAQEICQKLPDEKVKQIMAKVIFKLKMQDEIPNSATIH